jgi:hypothetical protein
VGSTGPAGPSNLTTQSLTASDGASNATVTCLGGTTAIGGTYVLGLGESQSVTGSGPNPGNPSQWIFTFSGALDSPASVTAFCASELIP